MDLKLKEVTQELISAIAHSSDMGDYIDSADSSSEDAGPDAVRFTMSKSIDRTVPGRRGPGSLVPVGRITYTVTVTACYEPIDG